MLSRGGLCGCCVSQEALLKKIGNSRSKESRRYLKSDLLLVLNWKLAVREQWKRIEIMIML